MSAREIWTLGVAAPTRTAAVAERAEAAGWSGLLVVDSQNLSGDPYVALSMAATATDRLGLGTGVTNPYTRHAAATACSIASVQAISRGRAVLGIGRGDSSLAHLGLAPASVPVFERYLRRLQGYLRGDEVPFEADDSGDRVASVDALGLDDQPLSSRIHWLGQGEKKVPVDVAATGPKAIAAAARHAERITFAVGADETRLRWAIEVARTARRAAGLDPADLSFGAYVNIVAHPDVAVARQLVAGGLATVARFAVMHGTPQGPASAEVEEVLRDVHARYDMTRHTQGGSHQTTALTPEFIDAYGIVGSSAAVIARMQALFELGLDRLTVLGPSAGTDRTEAATAATRFTQEVIPAFA